MGSNDDFRVLSDKAGDYIDVKIDVNVTPNLTFLEALQYAAKGYLIQRPYHACPLYLNFEKKLRHVQCKMNGRGKKFKLPIKDVVNIQLECGKNVTDAKMEYRNDWIALDKVVSRTRLNHYTAFLMLPVVQPANIMVYTRRVEWGETNLTRVFRDMNSPVDADGKSLFISKSDYDANDWYICFETVKKKNF
jgi:hypothetical protein